MFTTTTTKIVVVNTSVPAPSEVTECEALIVKEDEPDEMIDDLEDSFDRWSAHIVEIVKASKDRLKTFVWASRHGDDFGLPLALYQALGSLRNLEKLHLRVVTADHDNWIALLEGSGLTKLQSVRLGLESAHGWDCTPLERFLATLPRLEDLSLSFPICCGPYNISLSTTFPNLKSLRLRDLCMNAPYIPTSRLSHDLLRRHPQLESLDLDDSEYEFALGPQDLPNLKVLRTRGFELDRHPDLCITSRPIEKLLSGGYKIKKMVKLVKGTLKSLEFDTLTSGVCKKIQQLSPLLHDLEELSIAVGENDVAAVLNSTSTTNIKTLHFRDWQSGVALSPSFLEDVGVPVSPRLERIICSAEGTARVFTVNREQDEGRVSLVEGGTLTLEDWE